ncbi:DnaJ-domain-containing protein [Basidiobolus meristosporus CBS 931.73]|uniref:DnaJ-domain-containing protein n=1 Tax=Basidiobolus meristosporus CBS 931.73 TaxID=1314790 RepID=A0A1Y1Z7D6_9FUNG|nr:DnaJ-domain-containing protein [Basidiobolus meristosporus CBS 931.73]|eukprot:ORY06208.1 DnaJ-domain-containing protein [Basidiobolus meristosporus CBS 931.73]
MLYHYLAKVVYWAFIPGLSTSVVQFLYYKFRYFHDTTHIPTHGNEKHGRDYKRIFVLITTMYFLYTVWDAERSVPQNYYQLLDVDQYNFQPKVLKRNFRLLSLKYHPDKNATEEAQEMFITLRQAFETLNDPIKRVAYNNLGKSYVKCNKCVTIRDYLSTTFPSLTATYFGTGVVLVALQILGLNQFGTYWRYMAWTIMGSIELLLLFNPQNSFTHKLFGVLFPHRTTAELISILHQVATSLFVCLTQIGLALKQKSDHNIKKPLASLCRLNLTLAQEVNTAYRSAFKPFQEGNSCSQLCEKMKHVAVNYTLLKDNDYNKCYNSIYAKISQQEANESAEAS